MPIFAGVLQPPEISSKISHCLCMAEARGSSPLGSTLREAYLSGNQVLVKALNPLAGGFVQQLCSNASLQVLSGGFAGMPAASLGEACLAVCFEVASGEPQPMARRIAKVRVPTTIGATLLMPMATIPSPLPSSDVPNQRLARSRFPSKEKPKNPSDRKLVIEPTSISRLSRN